jgi:hypothetical protein
MAKKKSILAKAERSLLGAAESVGEVAGDMVNAASYAVTGSGVVTVEQAVEDELSLRKPRNSKRRKKAVAKRKKSVGKRKKPAAAKRRTNKSQTKKTKSRKKRR